MLLLTPIEATGRDIRSVCVPGIRSVERRNRLEIDSVSVQRDEEAFREAALLGGARSFVSSQFDDQVKADMAWLYDERLVGNVIGQQYVTAIYELSRSRCAFCHIAIATSLDHSLPKSRHPRLAVEPYNLVPACKDCNLTRNVGTGHMSVSPYFDHWIENETWLCARVIDLAYPEDLEFYPTRPSLISDEDWEALRDFFRESNLGPRYADCAIEEFRVLASDLQAIFGETRLEDARDELETRVCVRERKLGGNRWRTAAAKAWLEACSGIDWREAARD